METHGLQRLPDFLAVHELNVINVKQRAKDPDEGVSPTGPGIQTAFELFQTLRQFVVRRLLACKCHV